MCPMTSTYLNDIVEAKSRKWKARTNALIRQVSIHNNLKIQTQILSLSAPTHKLNQPMTSQFAPTENFPGSEDQRFECQMIDAQGAVGREVAKCLATVHSHISSSSLQDILLDPLGLDPDRGPLAGKFTNQVQATKRTRVLLSRQSFQDTPLRNRHAKKREVRNSGKIFHCASQQRRRISKGKRQEGKKPNAADRELTVIVGFQTLEFGPCWKELVDWLQLAWDLSLHEEGDGGARAGHGQIYFVRRQKRLVVVVVVVVVWWDVLEGWTSC
ncbi:hypothetical protein BKA65DRAFT_537990 [Rhexocercosporidium sp. MPI-PUGE-AT-0058]|nr:hypothetical protein BKA65DRAFT_537990 [Rhexocercosporidium sp. MPI-PUGE-AT-0058]